MALSVVADLLAVRHGHMRRLPLTTVAVAVAAVLTLTGQQPSFRTSAAYVRVDVYPTANGLPVDDLQQPDFEVLEDGIPQAVTAFERVHANFTRTASTGANPTTVAESYAALNNGRSRVFVLYLDAGHVSEDASARIADPLARVLERLVGPDDLIALLTPGMSPTDLTFTKRPSSIVQYLRSEPRWGHRAQVGIDGVERQFQACYPGLGPTRCADDDRGVADEMIGRRREQMTIEGLTEAVQFLGDAREERKAVLVVTEGWQLYRPNQALTRQLNCRVPQATVGLNPATGRLEAGVDGARGPSCEGERMALAQLDNRDTFTRLTQRANRANVSFYTIDPRGLATFDSLIDQQRTGRLAPGQLILPPPSVDAENLRARQGAMRDLATGTDGLALMNSNDFDAALGRIVSDLSTYYLLGYYSTRPLDGKFHRIQVRVRRPGVQVRARSGFLAVGPPPAGASPIPSSGASADLTTAALKELAATARPPSLRLRGAVMDRTLWLDIEFPARLSTAASLSVQVVDGHGNTIGGLRGDTAAGTRALRRQIDLPQVDGPLSVTARIAQGTNPPLSETLQIDPDVPTAVVTRRVGATAVQDAPTADLRFRRNEQIRVEIAAAAGTYTATLLDRNGNALPIPITPEEHRDADGVRWVVAALPLAPLGNGDYVLQLLATDNDGSRRAVAFRVVP